MTTGWDQTHLVPNTLNYLIFVTLGWIPKLSFLGYVEVEKKMGCGLVAEPMCRVGRLRSLCVGWVGGFLTIMPRCGSILQAGPCQIFSLAENPRWSRVWQLELNQTSPNFSWQKLTWHDNWLGSNTFGPKHFESSYFCDFRLHTKIKLPRLCRSWKKRWAAGGWVGCGAYVLGGWVVSWQ